MSLATWVSRTADGAVDPASLRRAFATFPTGVTVVAVGGDEPHGMTASSFTSVSLDPPLVLVCVARSAVMHQRILAADCFTVSVLGSEHGPVAGHFADARRPAGRDQFDRAAWAWDGSGGAPYLRQAEAVFECRRGAVHDAGDHTIVLGQVVSVGRADRQSPLVYAHGRLAPWLAP